MVRGSLDAAFAEAVRACSADTRPPVPGEGGRVHYVELSHHSLNPVIQGIGRSARAYEARRRHRDNCIKGKPVPDEFVKAFIKVEEAVAG